MSKARPEKKEPKIIDTKVMDQRSSGLQGRMLQVHHERQLPATAHIGGIRLKNTVDIKKRIAQHKKDIKAIGGKDWNEVRIYRRLIEELKWVLSDKGGEKDVVDCEDKGGRDEGVLRTGTELH